MKSILKVVALLLLSSIPAQLTTAHAQGTAFTYQGRLNDGANPASGNYDLRFAIYDAAGGGAQQGNLLTNSATAVSNGLFTVTLDFGNQFPGADRWLEIAVRTNGDASFSTLTPRQALTPTPYAITASNVLGNIAAAKITGIVPFTQLPAGVVTNGGNISGIFTGDGAGVTNVNAAALNGLNSSNFWKTGGNAGTTAGTHFLGTTDSQPLEFKVAGVRVLRFEDNGDSAIDVNALPDGAPNVIGGAAGNYVAATMVGVTISGGGATNLDGVAFTNVVEASYATIGGGLGNWVSASATAATIAGGRGNFIGANGADGTIGGGLVNRIAALASHATIAGGSGNSIGTNADYGSIGGGFGNQIQDQSPRATIAGGSFNVIGTNADFSVIGGGGGNQIFDQVTYGTIAGGNDNFIGENASYASIGGGLNNLAANNSAYAMIPGGLFNTATNLAFAAGRQAKAVHSGSFVWADSQLADFSSVTNNEFAVRAARGMRIVTTTGGITLNNQPLLTAGSTNALNFTNPANAFNGTFNGNFGSFSNLSLGFSSDGAAFNQIRFVDTPGSEQVLVHAENDLMIEVEHDGAVSYGHDFTETVVHDFTGNYDNNFAETIGGTFSHTVSGSQTDSIGLNHVSTVGGSYNLAAQDILFSPAASGVGINVTSPVSELDIDGDVTLRGAVAPAAVAATNFINIGVGSVANAFANGISFFESSGNPAMSLGYDGTIAGSANNALRIYNSTGSNIFTFEHGGALGLGVVDVSSANTIQHFSGAVLTVGGSWVNASDRNAKENFTAVNPSEVLARVVALPLTEWNYKTEGNNVKHIGPMAQDFRAAFQLGMNDKSIATVDADGVALAAIQGLNQKLEKENAELRARLERLEKMLAENK